MLDCVTLAGGVVCVLTATCLMPLQSAWLTALLIRDATLALMR